LAISSKKSCTNDLSPIVLDSAIDYKETCASITLPYRQKVFTDFTN
jgi:hypothetical protein